MTKMYEPRSSLTKEFNIGPFKVDKPFHQAYQRYVGQSGASGSLVFHELLRADPKFAQLLREETEAHARDINYHQRRKIDIVRHVEQDPSINGT